jgi:threonyl-tRNA synthetase
VKRKIRDAELRKAAYMLVVGDKEAENDSVAIRRHREGDQGEATVHEAIDRLRGQIAAREA